MTIVLSTFGRECGQYVMNTYSEQIANSKYASHIADSCPEYLHNSTVVICFMSLRPTYYTLQIHATFHITPVYQCGLVNLETDCKT